MTKEENAVSELIDSTGFELLYDDFLVEFSFLEEIKMGSSAKLAKLEPLPAYLAYFLAAAFSANKRACCFVLPVLDNTPFIAGTLMAFYDIMNRFDEFLELYANRAFEKGSRVRVIANKEVYDYQGFRGTNTEEFWLSELGDPSSCRNEKLRNIVLIEPTKYRIPKGKLGSMGKPQPVPVDKLLDIQTYGNCSLYLNSIMAISTQTVFSEFADSTFFARAGMTEGASVSSLLPLASVDEDGDFRFDDQYQCAGEPAIAVSSRPFNVSLNCRRNIEHSKRIVVCEIERLTRNASVLDSLLDSQKLIMFAAKHQNAELNVLREKGVLIWELTLDELQLGQSTVSGSLGAAAARAASQNIVVDLVDSDEFELCAVTLESFKKKLNMLEDSIETIDLIVKQLYFLLLDLSSSLIITNDEIESHTGKLNKCIEQFEALKFFLPDAVQSEFVDCLNTFRNLLASVNTETPKGLRFRELIGEQKRGRNVIVARTAKTKASVQTFLNDRYNQSAVVDVRGLVAGENYDVAICLGWPGSSKWNKIVHSDFARSIVLLAYEFESRWYRSFERYQQYEKRKQMLLPEDKLDLLGLPKEFLHLFESVTMPVPLEAPAPEFSFKIEQEFAHLRKDSLPVDEDETRECKLAHYFSFVGDTYAYLTPSHEIPVLNDVLEGKQGAKIRFEKASNLEAGDILMFRETGPSNVLREIAEQRVGGADVYAEIRSRAEAWRVPLQKISNNAKAVTKFLAERGLKKDWQTINNWLFEPDQIGPGDISDIIAIGNICNDDDLKNNAEEIMTEIREIRRLHVLAGHTLSEMILTAIPPALTISGEAETELNLDIGTVWIVTVEYIEKPCGNYPTQFLNSLRWS